MSFTYLIAKIGSGLRDPSGAPMAARVRLTPSQLMTNGTVTVGTSEYTVAADGTLSGLVAANDDAGTVPGSPYAAYYVEIIPRSGDSRAFWARVPAASPGGIVDLNALAPLVPPSTLVASDAFVGIPALTPTAVATTNVTASAGQLVMVDATLGPLTVTLPLAAARSWVGVKKVDSSANIVTIARAGADTIGSSGSTSIAVRLSDQTAILQANGPNWVLPMSHLSVLALDGRFLGISTAIPESQVTNLVADLAAKLAKPTTPGATSLVTIDNAGAVSTRTLPDVQIFTASGTWTKPAGATVVAVAVVAGGGGGGAGARRASATASSGGAGGGGGGWSTSLSPASVYGATETVTVGNAGSGAPAIAVNDTNGATGGNGGSSSFGSSPTKVRVAGGNGGTGGNTGAATSGGGGGGINSGGSGGAGAVGAVGATAGSGSGIAAGGGGGGGGVSVTPAFFAGAGGGGNTTWNAVGGIGGAVDGAAGSIAVTVAPANHAVGGLGGGGGAASIVTAGGSGAAGVGYGGAGGGGGSSLNGFNSGAGGSGTAGVVVVISY